MVQHKQCVKLTLINLLKFFFKLLITSSMIQKMITCDSLASFSINL